MLRGGKSIRAKPNDMEVEKTMVVNDRKVQDLFLYSDLCLSGGIVNVANAVKEAIKREQSKK